MQTTDFIPMSTPFLDRLPKGTVLERVYRHEDGHLTDHELWLRVAGPRGGCRWMGNAARAPWDNESSRFLATDLESYGHGKGAHLMRVVS